MDNKEECKCDGSGRIQVKDGPFGHIVGWKSCPACTNIERITLSDTGESIEQAQCKYCNDTGQIHPALCTTVECPNCRSVEQANQERTKTYYSLFHRPIRNTRDGNNHDWMIDVSSSDLDMICDTREDLSERYNSSEEILIEFQVYQIELPI